MSEETKPTEQAEEPVVAQAAPEAPATEEKVEAAVVAEETPETVVEEKPAKKAPKAKAKKAEVAQDDFDWDAMDTGGFGEGYSSKEREDLEQLYGDTLNTIEEKKVIHGTVVSITPRDIVLNIGYKSDGLVSSSEFRDTPDLKIGDQIEVYIEEQENAQGQLRRASAFPVKVARLLHQ